MRIKCVAISLILLVSPCYAQDGSVEGDFNSNTGNNDSIVESQNTNETYQNTYNGPGSSPGSQPPPTAAAPTVMGGGGTDSCLMPKTSGIQVSLFGIAQGNMEQDPECNRRKDARLMGQPQPHGLGLQISGLSVMCAAPHVFKAMAMSSTPCPIYSVSEARILTGRDAYQAMRSDPVTYVNGYLSDKVFWDKFLRMDLKELPDVENANNNKPTLSERFRRTRSTDDRGGRTSRSSDRNPETGGAGSSDGLRGD